MANNADSFWAATSSYRHRSAAARSYKRHEDYYMAKNTGRGFRRGAVRGRSQTLNPLTRVWMKRNDSTGRFMDGKTASGPFKGVRKES